MRIKTALTIAGSDSGGGAGIQADLKSFAAFGVYGTSAITAITAQNTRGVFGVTSVPPEMVTGQIAAVLDDIPPDAIKIGMLGDAATVEAVAAALAGYEGPVVLDPVMVAASGDALLDDDAVADVRDVLLRRALVITPNLPEAAKLLQTGEAASRDDMQAQAERLLAFGPEAVLLKGGHGSGSESADILVARDAAPRWFVAPRIDTTNTHGTGCTLSSAIAAGLARGLPLADAVAAAKAYLTAALEQADTLTIGKGHGPVHHFHAFWQGGST